MEARKKVRVYGEHPVNRSIARERGRSRHAAPLGPRANELMSKGIKIEIALHYNIGQRVQFRSGSTPVSLDYKSLVLASAAA